MRQLLDHWAAGGGATTGLTWLEAEGPGQGRPQAGRGASDYTQMPAGLGPQVWTVQGAGPPGNGDPREQPSPFPAGTEDPKEARSLPACSGSCNSGFDGEASDLLNVDTDSKITPRAGQTEHASERASELWGPEGQWIKMAPRQRSQLRPIEGGPGLQTARTKSGQNQGP